MYSTGNTMEGTKAKLNSVVRAGEATQPWMRRGLQIYRHIYIQKQNAAYATGRVTPCFIKML